jgi:hypothetical protein
MLQHNMKQSEKGIGNMDVRQWVLFLPQTPAVPSSLRVSVWRRMQQLGAVALQNGVWVLPHIGSIERTLQKVLTDLEAQGGGGFLLSAQMLRPEQEERMIERFRSEREQDYTEFLDRCEQFLGEVDKETKAHKFTFAELQENEEDWHKLKVWLRKIHARDFFGGPQREAASTALLRCQQVLKDYTIQVYRQQGYDPPADLDAGDGTLQER